MITRPLAVPIEDWKMVKEGVDFEFFNLIQTNSVLQDSIMGAAKKQKNQTSIKYNLFDLLHYELLPMRPSMSQIIPYT